jgi:NAD(P)-dependent dehydrogenase (short-subunit alcohol dehydrogenase family)
MDLGLTGKVALVTAASKGMGKASAMGLAAEGAKVVMCARTESDLKDAAEEIRAKTKAEVLACRPTSPRRTTWRRSSIAPSRRSVTSTSWSPTPAVRRAGTSRT